MPIFCARIPYNRWRVAKKFYVSGNKEQIVKFKPSPQSIKKCYEMGLNANPLKVRLIRVELESGETEILATSLTDMKKYPIELFSDLYHCRWPVEEDYKTLKYRLQIENFSGKTGTFRLSRLSCQNIFKEHSFSNCRDNEKRDFDKI